MHSSRMRTARRSSRQVGEVCLSACWDTPPGCGPGNLQGMLGYTPLETYKACWDATCKACWDTTPLPPWTDRHV